MAQYDPETYDPREDPRYDPLRRVTNARYREEAERIVRAAEEAIGAGRVLARPADLEELFQISAEAVRQAIKAGRVHVQLELKTTKVGSLPLVLLSSALDYWGDRHGLPHMIAALRRGWIPVSGKTLGVDAAVWFVLEYPFNFHDDPFR